MWQPIDTVPEHWKDGVHEIVALAPEWGHGKRPIILRWYKYNGLAAWRDWDNDPLTPTHWHPLADLPLMTRVPEIVKPDALLDALRWKADQIITNHFGERVWLKQSPHGLTDCCPVDAPCDHHVKLTHPVPAKSQ